MKASKSIVLAICGLVLAGLLLPDSGFAAARLGQSCALTGPTAFLGFEMQQGAKAYFDKHAARDVVLTSKDDKYEPEQCRANTEAFLKDGVDVLFGYVGTPTVSEALHLANAQKTVVFGALTGADFLGDAAANPYAFAVRASYDAEIEHILRHLKEDLGVKRVALFVQRDAFGLAGINSVLRAQKAVSGIEIVPPLPALPAEQSTVEDWNRFWGGVPNYKRNTLSVGVAVRQVRGHAAQAVVLVGTARPCALAINQWHKMDFKVPMLAISFVGAKALASRLKGAENVYISQVVPDPWNADLPIVKQYQQDIGNAAGYGFVSLEGYVAASVIHQALKSVVGSLSADSLKTALESMSNYDAGGLQIAFGPADHRGMDAVYLSKVEKDGDSFRFPYVDKLTPAKP